VEGLQRTVGAPPDGEFGPVTLAAARAVCASTGPVVVALALIDARREWLLGLHVAGGKYDKGFKARCDELAELVKRIAAPF
jgi:lysozyme family protein